MGLMPSWSWKMRIPAWRFTHGVEIPIFLLSRLRFSLSAMVYSCEVSVWLWNKLSRTRISWKGDVFTYYQPMNAYTVYYGNGEHSVLYRVNTACNQVLVISRWARERQGDDSSYWVDWDLAWVPWYAVVKYLYDFGISCRALVQVEKGVCLLTTSQWTHIRYTTGMVGIVHCTV